MLVAETLPVEMYTSPMVFAGLQHAVFGKSWLPIGHASQMPKPGNYVAMNMAGFPVLAVRGKDNIIRAFRNACSHLGAPLRDEGAGTFSDGARMACQYHRWEFDSQTGKLGSATGFGSSEPVDPEDYPCLTIKKFDRLQFALPQLKCETWRGVVFVNMDPSDNVVPLMDYIAPLEARMKHIPMDQYTVRKTASHDIDCNALVYLANYGEGAHIPSIHPELAEMIVAEEYKVEVVHPIAFHTAPPRPNQPVNGVWAYMYPNMGVNEYAGDGVMIEIMNPVTPTKTRLNYIYLFAEGTPQAMVDEIVAASYNTTMQDKRICEGVQATYNAPNINGLGFRQGVSSPRHERSPMRIYNEVLQALRWG